MRKPLALLLALLLCVSIFTGCDEEEEPTQAVAEAATRGAETTQPPESTETVKDASESTEITEQSVLNTTVLRSGDAELQAQYILLAVDPEGPFLSAPVINEAGADALIRWLSTAQAQEIVANYGVAELGETVFSLPEDAAPYYGWVPTATEETKNIRLVVCDSMMDSGLLDVLLPVFEETCGYTVDVQESSASGAVTTAKMGLFDLVLTLNGEAAQGFINDGYARESVGFTGEAVALCGMEYFLCGPGDDPAGVARCETLADAFIAMGTGEHLFLSRGDDSSLHKLEKSLWQPDQEFGSWYISANTRMGPLLVMTEMEGGYVLTDKLTWLKFYQADGII